MDGVMDGWCDGVWDLCDGYMVLCVCLRLDE